MKIRTDFVTNSSSSSFVTYRITPGENNDAFMQLKIMLERLCQKYKEHYITDTCHGSYGLNLCDDNEITLTMWTPGLSEHYLDEADGDEMESRESNFHNFARWDDSYPPDAAVALSALFGDLGDEMAYISGLTYEVSLLDDDGQLSDEVTTDLTRKEAGRLIELLDRVDIVQSEIIGSTD